MRYAVFNGYVFGPDETRSNRLRFAPVFKALDKDNYIDLDVGAILGLETVRNDDDEYLFIECGVVGFRLRGAHPYSFQITKTVDLP